MNDNRKMRGTLNIYSCINKKCMVRQLQPRMNSFCLCYKINNSMARFDSFTNMCFGGSDNRFYNCLIASICFLSVCLFALRCRCVDVLMLETYISIYIYIYITPAEYE